jgi:hypothetical protein
MSWFAIKILKNKKIPKSPNQSSSSALNKICQKSGHGNSWVLNLILFHRKNYKRTNFSPKIIVTKGNYISARKKTCGSLPGPETSAGDFSSYIPPPWRSTTTLENL